MANNFLRIKNGITLEALDTAPTSPQAGDIYYDTTAEKIQMHNGSSWESVVVNATGDIYQEYANLAAFPATGASGVLYLALDTANLYRWNGTAYSEVSAGSSGSYLPLAGGTMSGDILFGGGAKADFTESTGTVTEATLIYKNNVLTSYQDSALGAEEVYESHIVPDGVSTLSQDQALNRDAQVFIGSGIIEAFERDWDGTPTNEVRMRLVPNKSGTESSYLVPASVLVSDNSSLTLKPLAIKASEVSMESVQIVNVADPTAAQHAATKAYVDTFALPLAGGTMSGDLYMGSNVIYDVVEIDATAGSSLYLYSDTLLEVDAPEALFNATVALSTLKAPLDSFSLQDNLGGAFGSVSKVGSDMKIQADTGSVIVEATAGNNVRLKSDTVYFEGIGLNTTYGAVLPSLNGPEIASNSFNGYIGFTDFTGPAYGSVSKDGSDMKIEAVADLKLEAASQIKAMAELSMESAKIVNLANPVNNQDAATMYYVDGAITTALTGYATESYADTAAGNAVTSANSYTDTAVGSKLDTSGGVLSGGLRIGSITYNASLAPASPIAANTTTTLWTFPTNTSSVPSLWLDYAILRNGVVEAGTYIVAWNGTSLSEGGYSIGNSVGCTISSAHSAGTITVSINVDNSNASSATVRMHARNMSGESV